ncbi:hypothetical protein HPB49_006435 [Dermacentor silvarum]|uniref:Uncharacterized protein n=1 Tax=Dermacentor silvarum TaxID=543639 RepID=A0ACB8C7R9_DERSI|nr:hypothetical protein HPB49_006435 [Dermacentor silvarum]
MPRLPEEDYKIVLRPKCAVNLTNIGLIALLEAIYATSKINQAQAEQADQVRVHPIKNTITISTPDRTQADAYRTLESLRCEEHNIDIPVSAYVPAPDDSIRGLVYRAYTNETDQAIHDEIANKNLQLPIVNARRLGHSKHFVITFAGRDLPSLIRYRREIDQSTSGGNTSQQDEPAKHVAWGSGKPNLRDKTTPQVTTSLETPPEQQSRNGRTTTQTREERSGYKISQAAREEGTPTRPQQSKPQQVRDARRGFSITFESEEIPLCVFRDEFPLFGVSFGRDVNGEHVVVTAEV